MSPFGGRADILRAARRTGDRTPARVIHRGELYLTVKVVAGTRLKHDGT
jgi:hypothetical protein